MGEVARRWAEERTEWTIGLKWTTPNGQLQMDNSKWTTPNGRQFIDAFHGFLKCDNDYVSIWDCPFGVVHLQLSIWCCPFQTTFP
jgi:hypothetical protein